MFFKYLEKIRNLGEKNKKIIAFFLSLFLTGVIFVFWLVFWLPNDLNRVKHQNKSFSKEESPLDTIKKQFSTISEQFKDIRKNLSGTVEYSQSK